MTVLDRISSYAAELTELRHDFHAHPELGFEETRTSAIVAEKLQGWGIEVHRGIGGTGVVGVLRGRSGEGRRIGLRADMDALPMEERTNLPYRSVNEGRFHGCGHDGHTTMLLGAARYLAETREFDGTAIFVFQPAEEGLGGARAMIADKLFERFPCDEIYGLHNAPQLPQNHISVFPGPAMAAADFFDIHIQGRGAHGAMPHLANDPVIIATTIAQALQSIASRNVDPLKSVVVSITQIHSGSAYNVIPDEAVLAGTVRTFDEQVRDLVRKRIKEITGGIASAYDAEAKVEIRDIFTVLENDEVPVKAVEKVAREVVGDERVSTVPAPRMASEDFADMLKAVPGAYFNLGQANDVPVHNPGYLFDDAILPVGASMLARIVETRSSKANS
jgi:amidohydrolase